MAANALNLTDKHFDRLGQIAYEIEMRNVTDIHAAETSLALLGSMLRDLVEIVHGQNAELIALRDRVRSVELHCWPEG